MMMMMMMMITTTTTTTHCSAYQELHSLWESST